MPLARSAMVLLNTVNAFIVGTRARCECERDGVGYMFSAEVLAARPEQRERRAIPRYDYITMRCNRVASTLCASQGMERILLYVPESV